MFHDFTEKQNEEDDCYGGMVLISYLVCVWVVAFALSLAFLIYKAVS